MLRQTLLAAAAGVLAALPVLLTPQAPVRASKSPMLDLAGRWSGTGTVQWKNGKQEPYKCVVTYFLGEGGSSVKQTLRCSNPADNRLELATLMQVSGADITGTWEETLSAMKGAVKGRVTETGFEALAHNQFFNARFEIAMAGTCEQAVTIRPSREIELIKASLRKC